MTMITGNEEEQFGMLRSYCQALLDANSGSTCVIKTEQCQDQFKFRGVYICLDALRRGFLEGCRRFVGFDGCHLSSGYKGILLAAMGIDANNQMYPFAWAVVEQETYKTWHWDKPIITMLEAIRVQLMGMIHKQRDGMTPYAGVICPNIQKILDLQKKYSASWIPAWNGEDEFELSGPYGDKRVVNIRHKTCSYRRWDISGIPCCHAVAALVHIREQPEKWVHTCFVKEEIMQTYSHVVHAVDSKDTWPAREPLLPPDVPKQVGRKKKQRMKSVNETVDNNLKRRKKKIVQEPIGTKLKRQNTTITCGKCGKEKDVRNLSMKVVEREQIFEMQE
ncbi:uncharacterized protein LOC104417714 [Eucalyptus grandis]|uniref:uncharacterized protein LOC104417714 n=1 Tax=Eucalyptus grandis TaxID=71139 RepID=UPI00192EA0E2|nr:uncharacterized protein LOC104417714 [Eucalyptus grandis]